MYINIVLNQDDNVISYWKIILIIMFKQKYKKQ